MKDERLADGLARIIWHDHGPEREIQIGIGLVPVGRSMLPGQTAATHYPSGRSRTLTRIAAPTSPTEMQPVSG